MDDRKPYAAAERLRLFIQRCRPSDGDYRNDALADLDCLAGLLSAPSAGKASVGEKVTFEAGYCMACGKPAPTAHLRGHDWRCLNCSDVLALRDALASATAEIERLRAMKLVRCKICRGGSIYGQYEIRPCHVCCGMGAVLESP